MKLSHILGLTLGVGVLAAEDPGQVLNLHIDYHLDNMEIGNYDVAELIAGETVTIFHRATNNEPDTTISIVGVGGAFLDPNTHEARFKLEDSALGPYVLKPGQSAELRQSIPLAVEAGNYVLAPKMYIAIDEELKAVPLRGQLAVVSDNEISFLDPRLLSLELFFGVLVVGASVFYFRGGGKGKGEKKKSDWLPGEYKKKTNRAQTNRAQTNRA